MAGYIRQSSINDGDTVTASLFNNEYNQLLAAFNAATGHKHDGTAAEGPVIALINWWFRIINSFKQNSNRYN